MNKKNILRLISIILIIVGLVLIAFIVVTSVDDNDDKKINNNDGVIVKPVTPDDVVPTMTYDEVYNMAIGLYGGENFTIEVEEENDRFVIKRTYKDNGNTERYYVDKETGSVYTDNIIVEG